VARDRYSPPTAPVQGGEHRRKGVRLLFVLLGLGAGLVLTITYFVSRQMWRDHALLSFCKAAQSGISITALLVLEKRHGIDDSYLVQAGFADYIDQAHSPSLEFRSQWFDPEFVCAITHDGQTVKVVQLLTLEGFSAD
jgi:hypothetical protein